MEGSVRTHWMAGFLAIVLAGCGEEGTDSSDGIVAGAGGDDSPLRCPIGQTPCADRCVYLDNDPAHCGACGTHCATDQTCADGVCVGDGMAGAAGNGGSGGAPCSGGDRGTDSHGANGDGGGSGPM